MSPGSHERATATPFSVLARSLQIEFQKLADVALLPQLPSPGKRTVGNSLNSDVSVWHFAAEAAPDAPDGGWEELHAAFASGRKDNTRPWFRCIGLMRGHGARTVVVERYYVCLDHKSEHASFYAHVDEERNPTTVRLHFFSEHLGHEQLTDLSPTQKQSYLGYVVCRRGNLPLVGRAMIRVPSDYIDQAASVEEPVNFLGQRLLVEGVPFMQQDSRFAVCADVAIWTLASSAHRRGLSERRVIADIVSQSGSTRTLRPRVPAGLTAEASAKVLGRLDFATTLLVAPNLYNVSSTLPVVIASSLPPAVRERLESLLGPLEDLDKVTSLVEQQIRVAADEAGRVQAAADAATGELETAESKTAEPDPAERVSPRSVPAIAALETLLDHILGGYLKSRMPIYLAVTSHALVVCGRSEKPGGVRYFVHDDQNGPYLAIDGLSLISKRSLRHQSGKSATALAPPTDLLRSFDWATDLEADLVGVDLPAEAIVLATPSRAMLPCWRATGHAVRWWARQVTGGAHKANRSDETAGESPVELPEIASYRSSVIMGIDYKSLRREQSLSLRDVEGARTFSAMHLAEWVVVVEGVTSDGVAVMENVYDASSSSEIPRMQFSRVLEVGLVAPVPNHAGAAGPTVEMVVFQSAFYPVLVVPSRVGKVAPLELDSRRAAPDTDRHPTSPKLDAEE